jgi:hypothetical protein
VVDQEHGIDKIPFPWMSHSDDTFSAKEAQEDASSRQASGIPAGLLKAFEAKKAIVAVTKMLVEHTTSDGYKLTAFCFRDISWSEADFSNVFGKVQATLSNAGISIQK